MYGYIKRSLKQKRGSETDPPIHRHLTYIELTLQTKWEKIGFAIDGAGTIGSSFGNKYSWNSASYFKKV